MSKLTNAQCFAGFVGLLLLVGGIVGLTVIDGGDVFSEGGNIEGGEDLLLFEVNGWANLASMVVGAFGVLAAFRPSVAKVYATVVGVVYLAAAVWGIIDDNTVADLFPVNREDNVLNLGIGLLGLVTGVTSGPGKRYRKVAR